MLNILLHGSKVKRRANFPLRGKSRAAGIGVHFHRPQGGRPVFHGRSPVVWFCRRQAAFILAPQAAHLASAACLHNSRGRSPENRSGRRSRSRTEPLAPRAEGPAAPSTLAAKPRQPSGIPPSADSSSKAHGIKYRTQQKAPVFRLVLFYYSCPCRASWPPRPCTP